MKSRQLVEAENLQRKILHNLELSKVCPYSFVQILFLKSGLELITDFIAEFCIFFAIAQVLFMLATILVLFLLGNSGSL